MDFMIGLFASGRVVDLVLAVMALEAIAFVVFRRQTGRGIAPGLLWNLLAGAGLLIALRGALVGATWPWIGLPLMVALVAHIADIAQRLRT
jgi:hypothetical protein